MRLISLIAVALATVAAPAIAQEASAGVAASATKELPRAGQQLRTSTGRVGPIDRVNADGSVRVIYNSRIVTVPANTITVADGRVTTSLTKREITNLR